MDKNVRDNLKVNSTLQFRRSVFLIYKEWCQKFKEKMSALERVLPKIKAESSYFCVRIQYYDTGHWIEWNGFHLDFESH